MTTHGAPRGTLFGSNEPARPLARRSDPATSHQAATSVAPTLGKRQAQALDILRRYGGLTPTEMARCAGFGDPRVLNRRLPELERLGKARRGAARRCNVTGRSATTWWAADERSV